MYFDVTNTQGKKIHWPSCLQNGKVTATIGRIASQKIDNFIFNFSFQSRPIIVNIVVGRIINYLEY